MCCSAPEHSPSPARINVPVRHSSNIWFCVDVTRCGITSIVKPIRSRCASRRVSRAPRSQRQTSAAAAAAASAAPWLCCPARPLVAAVVGEARLAAGGCAASSHCSIIARCLVMLPRAGRTRPDGRSAYIIIHLVQRAIISLARQRSLCALPAHPVRRRRDILADLRATIAGRCWLVDAPAVGVRESTAEPSGLVGCARERELARLWHPTQQPSAGHSRPAQSAAHHTTRRAPKGPSPFTASQASSGQGSLVQPQRLPSRC